MARDILLFIGLGLFIGGLSGLLGIGGGILLVPALMWLCGFEFKKATGTTLAILVPPIGLPAAWEALQQKRVDVPAALCIAVSFAVGCFVVQRLIPHLQQETLRLVQQLFGLLMIYVAVRFILNSNREAATAAAGLISVALAWFGYLGLRILGRRLRSRPNLPEQVARMQQQGHGDIDYYI